MTYYEILQVTENASDEVIHMAYKALIKKYHPDLNRDNPEPAHSQTELINEAYHTLSDPKERYEYDEYLITELISSELDKIEYTVKRWKAPNEYADNPIALSSNAITSQTVDTVTNSVKSANQKLSQSKLNAEIIEAARKLICLSAREGLIYIHNKRYETKLALSIAKTLLSEFGDIQEIKPNLTSDISALESQLDPQITSRSTYTSSTYTSYTHNQQQNRREKVRKISTYIFVAFAVLVIILFIGSMITESDDNSDLTPVLEPLSGAILQGKEYHNASEITVTASGGSSCVVKLKNLSGTTKLSFYVRAGDTVTIGVPAEYMYVYFASGGTWYGNEHLFGSNTSYSMDDTAANFREYTWEYSLKPSSSGNFSETPIDEDEFKN